MIYKRGDDFCATTKRHPARTVYRTGVKKDGSFVACYAEFHIDTGAYITLSPVVLSRGSIHASGPYFWPNIEVHGFAHASHTPPNGAFRGFGAPQVYFGIERHVDRLADALGMDPAELRRRNLLKPGMRTATGQLMEETISAEQVLELALERSRYLERRADAAQDHADGRKRGVGLALFKHGTGFTGAGESRMKSLVGMHILPDGGVEILSASTDMGQGTATIFPQIAASALGVSYDRVFQAEVDTDRVPDSGPTVASRTITIVGKVVHTLAVEARRTLLQFAAELHGGSASDFDLQNEVVLKNGSPVDHYTRLVHERHARYGLLALERGYTLNPKIQWDENTHEGDAYPAFAWGCVVAEVAVDPDTLEVAVTHLSTVHDIGTVMHPVLAAGQIEGGMIQAMGYGLMEEVKWKGGSMLNPSFTNYIIPTALDVPDLDVGFFENPFQDGPFGAKGVGEIPMSGPAPALANAIAHAIGAQVFELPVTPERILSALEQRGERS
jgi:CO/xanthine dehydrogenase Mo-binding subunit